MCCIHPITNGYVLCVPPELDLHSVRIIRAISEHGTISAAAASLGFSQPAISQHLQRIETKLGFPLVMRSGRGVRLTEAGQVTARHAVSILSALDAANGDLAELAGLTAGSVRIAAFPTASSTLIPRLLRTLRDRHPHITVTYIEAEPPEAIAMVRDGAADLAITFAYPGDRSDPHRASDASLATVSLFTEPVVVVVPAEHQLASSDEIRLADLHQERWIAGCPLCRGHLLAACEAVGVRPQIELETDNAVAVLNLVASGLGVALLPQLALTMAPVSVGVAAKPTWPQSDRSIQLVMQSGSQRVPAVGAALDALADLDGADWGLTRA